MDLLKDPTPPKDIPKSRIPIPASLYIEGGRSNYLADLSEQVYAKEQEELAKTRREQRKLKRRKGKRKSGGGVFSDEEEFSLEDEDDSFDYGPPGILHTTTPGGALRKVSKVKKRSRPRSELGDSSIELLGPSASLETDESDGTGDILTESLEFDEEEGSGRSGETRESRSATEFRRYSVKGGGGGGGGGGGDGGKERRKEYRKSTTLGGGGAADRKDRERIAKLEEEILGGSDGRMEFERYTERHSATRGSKRGRSWEPPRGGSRSREREVIGGKIEGEVGGERGVRRETTRGDPKRYPSDYPRAKSKGRGGAIIGAGDHKRYPTDTPRGKPKTKEEHSDKWQREPGRPLSSAGMASRYPSKTPSRSPIEGIGGSKERKKREIERSPGKIPGISKEREKRRERREGDKGKGISPKRYESKEPSSKEKVEKWKGDIEKKTGMKVEQERIEGRRRTQKVAAEHQNVSTNQKTGRKEEGQKWSRVSPESGKGKREPPKSLKVPGAGGEGKYSGESDDAGAGGSRDRKSKPGEKDKIKRYDPEKKKRGDQPPAVDWDPKEKYDPEDDWMKEIASKPPKAKVPPETDPEKLKEDLIRDTAAGMRLLQLCQSGDWYGVDGHLRYFEKRIKSGATMNTLPLKDLKDEASGWTPLMYAIKDNRIPVADRMIDLGCDVNSMAKDGYCAIHMAALHGKDDTIRFLIYKRADVSVVTETKKQNVLHIAATRSAGNTASVLRALMGALPPEAKMVRDGEGNIPLVIALKNGMKGACQELLNSEAAAQLQMTSGEYKETPLHVAARKRDLEICRLLVDAGANIDAVNDLGQTPLHIASEIGDDNLCKYLYLCKANPHLADNEDRTPIHLAAIHGHTNLIDLLADKFKVSVFERTKDGSTLMHIASLHGHPETAMALFRKGVPLQMPNKNGARSIHTAAKHGHAQMISKLIEKGEKVDAVTNDNFTALHIATEAVRPNVVETLLGYGADVHIKGGKNQETPLHIAARVVGGEKCALMLLKSGADPNITMENGETPLHVAARHGRLKIIHLLLMDGGNPQQRAKDGDTPLHLACRHGHLRVVQILLEHVRRKMSDNECTLYINMVTTKGETALHYAARLNPAKITLNQSEEDLKKEELGKDIVKMLLEGGASTSRLTKETNETAFHYACKEGNNDVLKEMLSRLSVVECQRALNRQSAKGWSPLLIACRRGHTKVVGTLLDFHARVDVFDTEGRSGLHLAAENGYQEICGILLEHKAFINAKSRVGLTALHLAATKGFTRLCLFLIQDHGAAVDALTLKKQTPLHLAAESGQLEVCRLLMGLRANPDATDDKGQKPIHLAAQNNHAEVIKLFLKHSPQLVNSFTKDGSTCSHLAAMQGSVAVLEELMKFDKQGVIHARNRSTDATALQLAAEGGHAELVKTLLANGASASDENRAGYTAAHLAAKNGHTHVLEALRNAQEDSINLTSRKLGMTALHIAAYYGQTETVRELLQYIPATSATDPPLTVATSFIKELGTESGLTPLHMASYSGEENVVRLLLNFEGVQVDAPTANFGFNPLHLACRGGHITVVGLLLSRSSELLESKDASGKASLHIAAVNGHKHMVEVLLGQGAEIDAIDKELWTPLICAAQAGHLDVVKLLVESGGSPLAKTSKGQSAIWFAAAENHVDVLSYLMKRDHDTYGLLQDKDFIFNLCVCGKNIDNEPIDEFVLSSPAPVDVAAKMSSFLVYVATREKERAKDLLAASKHCETMASELLALAAAAETPEKVLESVDRKGVEFLDVLIENEQKEVIAHTVVQRHLQEVWVGHLDWADWKLLLMFFSFVFAPPVWITFSLPFGPKYNKIPIIKFMSYLTSHIHLMILLCLTCVTPIHPVFPIRQNLTPYWFEWMLFAWLGGLLIAEVTTPSDKSGLGWIKVAVLFFCYLGILLHGCAIFMDKADYGTILYLRDQLLGCGVLLACVQILDFLSFHYLFGPWAIIIGNLMKDLARFLAVLTIFMLGFSLVVSSLNHPIHPRREAVNGEKLPKALTNGLPSGVLVTPVDAFELLFFALFGLNNAGDMKIEVLGQPDWTIILFKIFFGVYLLVTVIVLINLLIAMMSDTYQRIEAQSDIEWKFGLAKLIRAMHRTTATPSPLNLFVDWGTWIYRTVEKARQPKNRLKWEQKGSTAGLMDDVKIATKASMSHQQDGTAMHNMTAGERWKYCFQKVKMGELRQSQVMNMSMAQLTPMAQLAASHENVGSALSTSAANRIEAVTDWHVIGKKYRVLVGKEEPVEEDTSGDDKGSRQGHSSSHMGSSMMATSKQGI